MKDFCWSASNNGTKGWSLETAHFLYNQGTSCDLTHVAKTKKMNFFGLGQLASMPVAHRCVFQVAGV